jgi:lysozyme
MPQKNNFTYSQNGLTLTQKFEGLRLTAYQDQVGVWTIGYGHTGKDVQPEHTITQEQANNLLMQDVASAVAAVNRLVTVAFHQNGFDALVDFAFNLGNNALAGSTLLRKLNASDFGGAAAEFPKWCKAGGKIVQGLLRRREAEQQLFQQGMPQPAAPAASLGMAPAKPAPPAQAFAIPATKKAAAKKVAAKKAAAKKAVAKKTAAKKAAPKKATAKKSPAKKKASRK